MATSVTPTATSSTPCWRVIVRVVPPTSLNNLPSGEQTEQALEVEDGTIICNNYENGGEIKYSLGLAEMYKFSFDSIFGVIVFFIWVFIIVFRNYVGFGLMLLGFGLVSE